MPFYCGNSGCFHSARTSADYDNIFRGVCLFDLKPNFFHCLWIDRAAKFCMFIPNASDTIFVAAKARSDIFGMSCHQFVRKIWIGDQCASHVYKVNISAFDQFNCGIRIMSSGINKRYADSFSCFCAYIRHAGFS